MWMEPPVEELEELVSTEVFQLLFDPEFQSVDPEFQSVYPELFPQLLLLLPQLSLLLPQLLLLLPQVELDPEPPKAPALAFAEIVSPLGPVMEADAPLGPALEFPPKPKRERSQAQLYIMQFSILEYCMESLLDWNL